MTTVTPTKFTEIYDTETERMDFVIMDGTNRLLRVTNWDSKGSGKYHVTLAVVTAADIVILQALGV
jgi:hypothetical protein